VILELECVRGLRPSKQLGNPLGGKMIVTLPPADWAQLEDCLEILRDQGWIVDALLKDIQKQTHAQEV
jgi:hypothetical protein